MGFGLPLHVVMSTTYCTPAELRADLELDEAALPDITAERWIETAEDMIDVKLGGRLTDPSTGRKVAEADVEAWQWDKLKRAAVKLAGIYFENPDRFGPAYMRERGPDFEVEGPIGSRLTAEVLTPLQLSGLIVAGAKMGQRPSGNRALSKRFFRTQRG